MIFRAVIVAYCVVGSILISVLSVDLMSHSMGRRNDITLLKILVAIEIGNE